MKGRLILFLILMAFANRLPAAPVLITFDEFSQGEHIDSQYWDVGAIFRDGLDFPLPCYITSLSQDADYAFPSPPSLRCNHPLTPETDTVIPVRFMDKLVPGYLSTENRVLAQGISFFVSSEAGVTVTTYDTSDRYIQSISVKAGLQQVAPRKNAHKIIISGPSGSKFSLDTLAFELIRPEAPPEPPTSPDKGQGNGSPKEPADDLTQGTPANAVANAMPRPYGGACPAGNPCNPANGNKYQTEEDYRAPATGLSFTRTYNSTYNKDIGLGYGWISSVQSRLEIDGVDPSSLIVRRSDGRGEPFICAHAKGSCKGEADTFLALTKDASGYTLTHPQGITERFDTVGRLTTKTYPAGTQLAYSYDAQGRVASVTGPFGHTLNYAYDAQGHLVMVTYPDGQTSQYGYDASSNLVQVTYPDGRFKTYHYENAQFPHHLTGITNENGVRISTYGYDTLGRANLTQHAQTDNGGPQERFTLGYPSVTEAAVQDAIGSLEYMQFQINLGVKNMVYRSSPGSDVMTQTFDADNNVLTRTDEEGRTTAYEYNRQNQLIAVTEASGTAQTRTTTYKYLSRTVDLPTEISRPSVSSGRRDANVTTIAYNAQNNPVTITRSGYTPGGTPVSRQIAFTYNAFGQVTSFDGPRTDVNDVTTYAYYECTTGGACGHLSRVTDPLGHVTTFGAYDAHGRVLEMTDPNGLKTNYVYDLRGRVLSIARTPAGGIGRTTQFTYDNAGNLVQVMNPDGMTLIYTYDAANYLRTVTDNLGNKVTYFYDLKGNRTKTLTSDPDGTLVRSIENAYDVRNRVSQINEGGAVTQLSWDGVGNLAFEINPKNIFTRYAYDAFDRLLQAQYASGAADYGYDVNDNPSQVVAPNSTTTQYAHDDLGNRLQEISPDRGNVTYTHDAAGNIKTATDARGATVAYAYDVLNRLVNVDYPGTAEDVTYTYEGCPNGIGRICAIQDASGSTSHTYDAFGNVTEMRRTELGVVYTTRYAYDAANRITSMTYPDGRVVSYTRDAIGRVTAVTASVNGLSADVVSNRLYRADQLVKSQTFGNGLVESRDYDLRGQLLNQYLGAADTWVYSYDANGNLTNLQTMPQIYTYEHDSLDRIWRTLEGPILEIGTPYVKYTYDRNGNRLSDNQGAYNYVMASNRLAATPYGAITLDPAGNTLADGAKTYTYNNAGQLAEARLNGVLQGSYLYNAQGSRTRKSTPSGTTVYHYDLKGRLLAETQPDGTLLRAYVWINEAPIAQIDRNLLGQETVLYLHTDHQGTPRLATISTGTVVWRWVGSAFGDIGPSEDPDNDGGLTTVNLRYDGQYFDSETGFHYNWNRYYDPKTGRYISSDPIGLAGGLNSYAYVDSNPLRWVDPLGLQRTTIDSGIQQALVRGDLTELQTLLDAAATTNAERAAVQKAIDVLARSTGNTDKLAQMLGRSEKAIRDAIHECKSNLPRAAKKNPNVRVDPRTGEVYPETSQGGIGDSIGNIWEFL